MLLRTIAIALSISFVVACGASTNAPATTSDAGQPADGGTTADAGSTTDAGTTTDAGPSTDAGTNDSCTGPCSVTSATDCSCIYNADCSPGFRCGEVDSGTCECGKRGTGKLNAPCTGPNDCETGLCLADLANKTFCTEPCQPGGETSVCGGHFSVCNDFLGLCTDR